MYLGSSFTGESKDLGHFLFRLVDDFPSISTPYAFVFGGETTVDLKNKINGIGGRNQEAVLQSQVLERMVLTEILRLPEL